MITNVNPGVPDEHNDPRPRIEVPGKDASPLEVMAILDASIDPPVPRDSEGRAIYAAKITVPRIHAFSTADVDQSLPAPEQWVIRRRMRVEECAEMIERHVEFVDKKGCSVHLPTKFVRHYLETRMR
jgi:hypothetical protein